MDEHLSSGALTGQGRPMQLHQLLHAFDATIELSNLPNPLILGIAEDSRFVRPGELFVARPGAKSDGGAFVSEAIAKGAAAVIATSPLSDVSVPLVVLPGIVGSLSRLANLYFGEPSKAIKTLAITGTNGKTTSAYLTRHLAGRFGKKCGMIGTVEIDDGGTRREAEMTTPGAVDVAALLASMRGNGCAAAAMEVSSHALHQGRVGGIKFAGAAFTNLTGDHLDYHKTMEAYAAAKASLFESLDESAVAVVNAADEWSARMIQDSPAKVVKFGFKHTADYRALDIAITAQGSHFILQTPDGRAEVHMGLIGKHNIENALTAAALVGEIFGLTAQQIASGLGDAQGAPGRLQTVRAGQPFAVLVDYAHTDDALMNVLTALRPLTRGRLRVLFGCGGDRDPSKRPRMARVAQKLADDVYITSDNPRTELPEAIIKDIEAGLVAHSNQSVRVDVERRSAIRQIIGDAQAGDVVLIAGKGHENYQIVGKFKHHFDDVEEATAAIGGAEVSQ